eukprot:TRINITY_DN21952_c0_g1_i1.p1 TRINITY_DN21952_c0_g1~~TRINITY_DN21952_c0_g1_i1.p1  ORF type:complete len:211 (+),score=52.77 TRINITY_DN21952_c0_g1_i1:2-634(+)
MASPMQRFHTFKRTEVAEVPCTVGQVTKMKGEVPCVTFVDVSFHTPSRLNYLVFQNYYTHSIKVMHYEPQSSTQWKTVLSNYKLMKNPHHESDAQDYHCIDVFRTFNRTFDCFRVTALRIILTQPSPQWISFALHNIKAYVLHDTTPRTPPPSVHPAALNAASEVLSLARSIKTHRASYNHTDETTRHLNRVPLDTLLQTAQNAEIVELQ